MLVTKQLFFAAIVSALAACSEIPGTPFPDIPANADIVVLGEVHDNAQHHLTQAGFIRAVQPSAVVFEMLSPTQAQLANNTGDRGEGLRDSLKWQDSGWPEWSLYQPVFEAAGTARIYGMALPRERVRRAVSESAAAVFTGDARDYGLHIPLPDSQQASREELQQTAHCNMLPASLLAGMVEAQRLRDAAFARTALAALSETRGPVVVITGTGHARKDWGIPAAVQRASADTAVFSVGLLEESVKNQRAPVPSLYDITLYAQAAEREDPCKRFSAAAPN